MACGVPTEGVVMASVINDAYRWVVEVHADGERAYAREVRTDGPKPGDAIKKALTRIVADPDNDLWMHDSLRVTVKRVR